MKILYKLLLLTLLVATTLTLCSCNVEEILGGLIGGGNIVIPGPTPEENEDLNKKKQEVADTLNGLLGRPYQMMRVEIYTTVDDLTLRSFYDIDTLSEGGEQVHYTVEQRGTFTEVDGTFIAPEGFIITKSGTGTVVDGALISLGGEIVESNFDDFVNSFYFDAALMEDFQINGEHVQEVHFISHDTAKLLGRHVDAEFVQFHATYSPDMLSRVEIEYTLHSGATVNAIYTFK